MRPFSAVLLGICLALAACGGNTAAPETPTTPLADSVPTFKAPNHPALSRQWTASTPWEATYTGKLDGKMDIDVVLHGLGEHVRGTLTYRKPGNTMTIIGTYLSDGSFFLREYLPSGLVTGVLSGAEDGERLVGTWYAPGTDKDLRLELTPVAVTEGKAVQWPFSLRKPATIYGYRYGKEGPTGSLRLTPSGDRYRLEIQCVGGAPGYSQATIDAAGLQLDGNVIAVSMPDSDCQFTVVLHDGWAIVRHVDEHTDCEFGVGAGIEGEYLALQRPIATIP